MGAPAHRLHGYRREAALRVTVSLPGPRLFIVPAVPASGLASRRDEAFRVGMAHCEVIATVAANQATASETWKVTSAGRSVACGGSLWPTNIRSWRTASQPRLPEIFRNFADSTRLLSFNKLYQILSYNL